MTADGASVVQRGGGWTGSGSSAVSTAGCGDAGRGRGATVPTARGSVNAASAAMAPLIEDADHDCPSVGDRRRRTGERLGERLGERARGDVRVGCLSSFATIISSVRGGVGVRVPVKPHMGDAAAIGETERRIDAADTAEDRRDDAAEDCT